MSEETILEVEALSAGYGRSRVLFDVSLVVPRKGAVAILGRNGAGKTTLLKTLAGEISPMSGSIRFDGRDCAGEGTEHRVRRDLGYVPQEQAVFGTLTVRENPALGAIAQRDRNGFEMALDFFPKLGARLSQQAGTLSGGERKMLAISRAILGRPRLLMLDEPTEGVWVGVIEENLFFEPGNLGFAVFRIASYTGWPIGGPASATEEEIIYADVNLADARRKRNWNEYNQVLRDRRSDVYDEMLGSEVSRGWY